MHSVHRCELVLEMSTRSVARVFVSVSVCWLKLSSAKTAESTEMPFGRRLTRVVQMNNVFDGRTL